MEKREEEGGGEGEGRKGEVPIWEAQLHQNYLIQLQSPQLHPLPHSSFPSPFLGNQPTYWPAPELDTEGGWEWRAQKEGAGLKPPVLGTKMTQKGKDSDSNWQTARAIRRQRQWRQI